MKKEKTQIYWTPGPSIFTAYGFKEEANKDTFEEDLLSKGYSDVSHDRFKEFKTHEMRDKFLIKKWEENDTKRKDKK